MRIIKIKAKYHLLYQGLKSYWKTINIDNIYSNKKFNWLKSINSRVYYICG